MSGAPGNPRTIHGWLMTSLSVARADGLVTSILDSKCLHSDKRVLVAEDVWRFTGWLTGTKPNRVFDQAALDLGMQRRHALVVEGDLAAD